MMKNQVLIIGAGIAGLSLALFLKKAGIESVIYEKYPYDKTVGSSFRINRSGVQVLKSLGLSKEVKQNSHSPDRLKIIAPGNIELATINLMQSKDYSNRSIQMQRSDLMEILMKKAKQEDITIMYNKKMIKYQQSPHDVTIHFEDGDQATGSLLVGADGLHSPTRKQMFPTYVLKYANSWALYGAVASQEISGNIETIMDQGDEFFFMKKDVNFMVSKSHPSAYYNISWQASGYRERRLAFKEFEGKTENQLKSDIMKSIENDWDERLPEIVSKSKIIPKQLHTIDSLPSWSINRVVLIGDAAHTINPNTGYGSSVALEDAMYLAKMLRDYNFRDAFYYYEYDRKNRVEAINNSVDTFDISRGLDFSAGFDIGLLSGSHIDPRYTVTW